MRQGALGEPRKDMNKKKQQVITFVPTGLRESTQELSGVSFALQVLQGMITYYDQRIE